MQRFPSSRQQSKGDLDSPLSQRSDRIKPTATPAGVEKSKPNWSPSNGSTKNQNAPSTGDKPVGDSSPLVRKAVAPNPVVSESDWSPPVRRAEVPNHLSQPTVDKPPTTTNSFQRFLMKKTTQVPSGGVAQVPNVGVAPDNTKILQDFVDSSSKPVHSSPKPARNPLRPDTGNSSPKQSGLPKELPPSILNRIAKNVAHGRSNRQQYGNIASSGDLIANLAIKYGKQPVGGAVRVQDPMPVKQQPVKPPTVPVNMDHINEECNLFHWLKFCT